PRTIGDEVHDNELHSDDGAAMNKRMLQNVVGKQVRLRPKIHVTNADGRASAADDPWLVEEVTDDALTLRNAKLDVRHALGLDNVRSFQTPDFLLLRCDMTVEDGVVTT